MHKFKYIDLFAGAGGLSEGFIKNDFIPVAHVEMDQNACKTIRTRIAYHYLKNSNNIKVYNDYLLGKIKSKELYSFVPVKELDTVINAEINSQNINHVFTIIDNALGKDKVDLIIGGPPCQAYSLIGRARDPNRMKNDHRNFLYQFYADFLRKYQPKYFVFENVRGLLSAGNYFEKMKNLFQDRKTGYKIAFRILNAKEFGVLQSRERVIVIGRRGNEDFEFPSLKKIENKWELKSALLDDLPALQAGDGEIVTKYNEKASDYLKKFNLRNGGEFVTQHITRPHNPRDLHIYRLVIEAWINEKRRIKYKELPANLKTHKNQSSFLDRFKVIDPFTVSHTLVAHIAKDGHFYIYPDLKQVRSISVREAARIQSFPDDYFFEGGRTAAFKQIGNAVPPLMAQNIAGQIKSLLIEDH